jgi:hypothetical protein
MDLLHDFFPFHSSGSRYVPFGIRLAPEALIAFLPFSPIIFGLECMGMLFNAPTDMHVVDAHVSNNHLQDNPELVCRVMIGLGVFFEAMSFISKPLQSLILHKFFLLAH